MWWPNRTKSPLRSSRIRMRKSIFDSSLHFHRATYLTEKATIHMSRPAASHLKRSIGLPMPWSTHDMVSLVSIMYFYDVKNSCVSLERWQYSQYWTTKESYNTYIVHYTVLCIRNVHTNKLLKQSNKLFGLS